MSASEIPLSRPDVGELERELVDSVLRSGRLSIGPMQEQFERMVAARVGCEHGVAVSSGTAGLHLVLKALGVGPGDEVITTPFSFIASSNCIAYVGATPKFVDICPKSLNMDPKALERAIGPRTKAILAVEAFGNPQYMEAYAAIAARNEIALVEDSCEALGTVHKGRACGSFGRAAVFGFYPNKQVTTGEGGMIVTSDERLADLCRSMRNQGRAVSRPYPSAEIQSQSALTSQPVLGGAGAQVGSTASAGGGGQNVGGWLMHERLGYNYRLDEMSAALGVGQMKRLDELIYRKRRVAERYMSALMDHPDLILPTMASQESLSWFVFVVRLNATYTKVERDRILEGMRRHDIGVGDYFPCIHLQPYYRETYGCKEGDFPIAESVSQRTIALPFYGQMTDREVDLVAQTLALMVSRENLGRRS